MPNSITDLPKSLQAKLRKPGRPKAESTNESITIQLSPEVLAALQENGRGWQTRKDGALKQWLTQPRP